PREDATKLALHVRRTEAKHQLCAPAGLGQARIPCCSGPYVGRRGPGPTLYRVDSSKLTETLAGFRPQWTVRRGIAELCAAYQRHGLTREQFLGARYCRIKQIQRLQREGQLGPTLRWRSDRVPARL